MRQTLLSLCLAIALLPTTGCSDAPAPPAGPHHANPDAVRILPLGDSITQADRHRLGYRFWLWQSLQQDAVAADYVGTQARNHEGDPSYPADFDRNHEGHWGWRTDEVLAKLPGWLAHYDADIALVHLGTNDCLQRQGSDATLDELRQIAAALRADNPRIDIAFATLGPSTWQNPECLTRINAGLTVLQQQLHTEQSRVAVVDAAARLDPQRHLHDGLHPAESGERVIAAAWHEQLAHWLAPR